MLVWTDTLIVVRAPAPDTMLRVELTSGRVEDKFAGMEVSDARKLKSLEEENRKLKRIVADLTLDITMLKDINSKKW